MIAKQTLTRTRSVVTLMDPRDEDEFVEFLSLTEYDDDNVEVDIERPAVRLGKGQWADLGYPADITIAIWPGDRQDLMEQENFPE